MKISIPPVENIDEEDLIKKIVAVNNINEIKSAKIALFVDISAKLALLYVWRCKYG